jgi:hypothetical protein
MLQALAHCGSIKRWCDGMRYLWTSRTRANGRLWCKEAFYTSWASRHRRSRPRSGHPARIKALRNAGTQGRESVSRSPPSGRSASPGNPSLADR